MSEIVNNDCLTFRFWVTHNNLVIIKTNNFNSVIKYIFDIYLLKISYIIFRWSLVCVLSRFLDCLSKRSNYSEDVPGILLSILVYTINIIIHGSLLQIKSFLWTYIFYNSINCDIFYRNCYKNDIERYYLYKKINVIFRDE